MGMKKPHLKQVGLYYETREWYCDHFHSKDKPRPERPELLVCNACNEWGIQPIPVFGT